ncbi:MAG: hypothetical protein ACHQET_03550 [Chitinophagales bacterium]
MTIIYRTGLIFYCIGVASIGIQQFSYGDLRPVLAPSDWPAWIHGSSFWAFLTGGVLLIASALILMKFKARLVSASLGAFLLSLFIFFYVPYRLFISPNLARHMGLWVDPLKELALAGGAFVIASSCPKKNGILNDSTFLLMGRVCFSITMAVFGYGHFLYPDSVSKLVPGWIPGPYFWTYFAALALIGSGFGILFKIRIYWVAILTGIMIFIWFIVLHIPRAIADPYGEKGNELTSVFEALAFSGIAFLIAHIYAEKGDTQTQSPKNLIPEYEKNQQY